MRALIVPFVAVVALSVAGCGGSSTLDLAEVEESLLTDYVPVESARVERVECPDDVDLVLGSRFPCEVIVDGQELDVIVEQVDVEGTVELRPGQPVLERAAVEADVAQQTGRELGQLVTARCGEGAALESALLVVPQDARFGCVVIDENGSELTVVVRVDEDGAAVVEPAP